jgi:hypothetical protein
MRVNQTAFVILALFSAACINREVKKVNGSITHPTFSNNLIPEIHLLDSVELIYYRERDKPRFFTYLPSRDTALIRLIKENVLLPPSMGNRCSKEGKIYCFAQGNIFATFHFAYSGDSCDILTFVKHGNNYILPLQSGLRELLIKDRTAAFEL